MSVYYVAVSCNAEVAETFTFKSMGLEFKSSLRHSHFSPRYLQYYTGAATLQNCISIHMLIKGYCTSSRINCDMAKSMAQARALLYLLLPC